MGIVRKTKSVEALIDVFNRGESAFSVVQLIDMMKADMNKTTVYRILDRLESEGIIHSLMGKDGLKWYAKCSKCDSHSHNDIHPHFQCDKCGKVDCLSVDVVIPEIPNRKVEISQILLQGSCEDCVGL